MVDLVALDLTTGEPEISSPMMFNMNPANLATGAPTISRVSINYDQTQAWPFRVNWRGAVSQSIEFRTEMVVTRSGREQRRALRDRPRHYYDFQGWAAKDDARLLHTILYTRFGDKFIMPDPVDISETNTLIVAAGNSFGVAALADWMVEGAYVYFEDGDTTEVVMIQSVDLDIITINGAFANGFEAGQPFRRGVAVHLAQNLTLNYETNDVAVYSVNASADPEGVYYVEPPAAPLTFNGREVLAIKPNWKQKLDRQFDSGREVIDYGQGQISYNLPLNAIMSTSKVLFSCFTRADAQLVIDTFLRVKGQWGELYVPTWNNDLKPIASLTNGGSTFTVAGHDVYRLLKNDVVNKAIYVKAQSGAYYLRRITGVARSGANTVITVHTPWVATLTVDQIDFISYMPVTRFASDNLQVQWITPTVAEISAAFRTLETQEAET